MHRKVVEALSLFHTLSLSISHTLSHTLSISLSNYLSIYLSVCLSVYMSETKHSARLPEKVQDRSSKTMKLLQFLKLTPSKTKQFCETSFKNRKLSAELMALYQCVVRFVHPMSLKYCACHEKVMRSVAPVTQNHVRKPEDLMLQNVTSLRKSVPWPPNISDEHVSCTAPATRNSSLQILFKRPAAVIGFETATKPWRYPWQGAESLVPATACTFSTSQRPKVLRGWEVLWSSLLPNLRRATVACNFSSHICPDGPAPAALASILFDPPEPQNKGKHTVSRDFSTFSRTGIFFLLTLPLLWVSFLAFLFSDSSHLCFSICPYCRKFDF